MPVADDIIPVIAYCVTSIFDSMSKMEIFTGISLLTIFLVLIGMEIVYQLLLWIAKPEG